MAKTVFHAANTRGHADHGWLNAYHSFSFANYHDPERVHFGVLRVLNDDTVAGGTGFSKHPHDNMEIITIVLEGALEHKDSMGHAEALRTNEVQVMSAGSGLMHSEANNSSHDPVRLFQIWLFPDTENVTPRYEQTFFDPEDRINTLQMLVSPINKEDAGLKIHQDAWIYRSRLEKGKSLSHQLHSANHGVYALVIEGGVTLNDQVLNRRDALGISETDSISITANEDSDILLLEVPMR